jgi:hypothetical protein
MNQPLLIITQTEWNAAAQSSPRHFTLADIANKAFAAKVTYDTCVTQVAQALLDAFPVEVNAQQETYITADEARKRGPGNAEYSDSRNKWHIVEDYFGFPTVSCFDDSPVKYRALQAQPEPVEPQQAALPQPYDKSLYCKVRNEDTGELKTMTREAAQKLQAELGDTVDWASPQGLVINDSLNHPFGFSCEGIYTYRTKANLVKLGGELMTREAAIAKYEAVQDKCDIWIKNDVTIVWEMTKLTRKFIVYANECNCEYELRTKPAKVVAWEGSRDDVIALLKEVGLLK